MAKMFYTKEEVQEKLSITSAQLDKLIQDGRLREFRDGAKIMFKVDEVDDFNPADSTGEISLSPEDTSDIMASMDTGSSIGLAPMDTGSQLGLMPSDSSDQIGLDDTTEAADKDDTVITTNSSSATADSFGSGSSIAQEPLDLDKTQLTPDLADRVSFDSGGSSGSGLLDLSREADDTSLGAELLEEIYPSADEGAVETQLPTQMDIPSEPEPAEPVEEPVAVAEQLRVVQAYDSASGVYGAVMIVPFLILIYMAFATTSAVLDVQPALMTDIGGVIWYIAAGAAGLALLIWLGGSFVISQASQPRTPKVKKTKTKKTKAKKSKK